LSVRKPLLDLQRWAWASSTKTKRVPKRSNPDLSTRKTSWIFGPRYNTTAFNQATAFSRLDDGFVFSIHDIVADYLWFYRKMFIGGLNWETTDRKYQWVTENYFAGIVLTRIL